MLLLGMVVTSRTHAAVASDAGWAFWGIVAQ